MTLLIVLIAFWALPVNEISMAINYSLEGRESFNVTGPESLHVGEIETRAPEDVYNLYKPNKTYWTEDWYKTRKIQINSKGIREDEFRKKLRKNRIRVLFLGDSFTFGTGVNASQRYTDIIEKRMNERGTPLQSVNAGISGAGIDDFARYFRARGVEYEPDITVVSISSNDIWSRKELYQFRQRLIERNSSIEKPINSTEQIYLNRRSREYKNRIYENSTGAELVEGLEEIDEISGSSPVIVHGYLLSKKHEKKVRKWAETKENLTYVSRNPKFSIMPERLFLIPYDGHYNKLGHYWMAQQLMPEIESYMERDSSII